MTQQHMRTYLIWPLHIKYTFFQLCVWFTPRNHNACTLIAPCLSDMIKWSWYLFLFTVPECQFSLPCSSPQPHNVTQTHRNPTLREQWEVRGWGDNEQLFRHWQKVSNSVSCKIRTGTGQDLFSVLVKQSKVIISSISGLTWQCVYIFQYSFPTFSLMFLSTWILFLFLLPKDKKCLLGKLRHFPFSQLNSCAAYYPADSWYLCLKTYYIVFCGTSGGCMEWPSAIFNNSLMCNKSEERGQGGFEAERQ